MKIIKRLVIALAAVLAILIAFLFFKLTTQEDKVLAPSSTSVSSSQKSSSQKANKQSSSQKKSSSMSSEESESQPQTEASQSATQDQVTDNQTTDPTTDAPVTDSPQSSAQYGTGNWDTQGGGTLEISNETPVYSSPNKESGVAYTQPAGSVQWDSYIVDENGENWYSFVQDGTRYYIAYSDVGH